MRYTDVKIDGEYFTAIPGQRGRFKVKVLRQGEGRTKFIVKRVSGKGSELIREARELHPRLTSEFP